MNEIKAFIFEKNQVRTVLINNELWFVGKDVAETLGYSDTQAMTRRLDEDERNTYTDVSSGQARKVSIISESGIFNAVLGSKKNSAKRFKKWVTTDVLPSIRKFGGYLTNQKLKEALLEPDTLINLAIELKKEREDNNLLAQRVNELQPKADYTDKILRNKGLMSISLIAKDYGMSAIEMNRKLHELGVQFNQSGTWLLYSKHQKKGWTQSETSEIKLKNGNKKLVANTKWTQKGRLGIYELLKLNKIVPMIEQND